MADQTTNTEKNTETGGNKFNPLKDKVEIKSYTGGGQSQQFINIPEPTFNPPPSLTGANMPLPGGAVKNANVQQPTDPGKQPFNPANVTQPKPFNPQMEGASDSEKQQAAAQLATTIMNGYKFLHSVGNNYLQISESKWHKMVMSGEVDASVPVPYDYGKYITLGEFVQEYNQQAGETLVVTKQFEDTVMPPLTRVLAKHGHGMTDEGLLFAMFGQDLAVKSWKMYQMSKQTKDIVAFAREQSALGKQRPIQPNVQSMASMQEEGAKVVNMNTGQQQMQPVQQEQVVATDIQSQLLNKVVEAGKGDSSGVPQFNNPSHLTNIDKIYQDELKDKQRHNKTRQKLHGTTPNMPKPIKKSGIKPIPAVKGVKRGPGRPKGSTKKAK